MALPRRYSPAPESPVLKNATIAGTHADGTADLNFEGTTVYNIPVLDGVRYPVASRVYVLATQYSLLVIGGAPTSGSDVDWTPIDIGGDFSNSNLEAMRSNGIVYFRGDINHNDGPIPDGYTEVAVLPASFRPTGPVRVPLGTFAAGAGENNIISLRVGITGAMQVFPTGAERAGIGYMTAVSWPGLTT